MTFLLETIHGKNETELHRFYRDKLGKKKKEIVRGFKPYFYVNADAYVPDDYRITSVETGYVNLLGKPVKKIYVSTSKAIRYVRDLFQEHYEADIPIGQRYIIDVLGEEDIYKLKTLALDIETDSKDVFPNVDDPDQSIISCSFVDNFGNKRKYVYVSKECKSEVIVDAHTRVFKTEESLLEGMISYIKINDPDIITGWNVVQFDLAYIINRMKKLKVRYSGMSPMDTVFCSKSEYTDNDYEINIRGRIILDGMAAYMHFRKMSNQGRAEKYSLEFTGQAVLGTGKIKHEKETMHDMWINDINKLLDYNLKDSELVINILEKLEIVEFFNYIRTKSFASLNQIYRTTALVDGYLLRIAHNKVVLPSKSKGHGEKYKGAHVFPPIPGVYKNVIALDLKALYPNIIKTFNVGYETFNPDGPIKLKEGIAFNDGIGLMSQVMRELDKERAIYKKLMWKADIAGDKSVYKLNYYKQYSVKVLMNCFSGDTQLLTPSGEKNIKKCKIGDVMYSINPETHALEEKRVTKTYEYDYNGDMVHFNTQNMDLIVTPNHNMIVEDKKRISYMIKAKDYNTNNRIPIHSSIKRNLPHFINLLENVKYSDYRTFLFKNKELRKIKQELSSYNVTFKKINMAKCEIFCNKQTLVELWSNGYDIRIKHSRNKNCNYNIPFVYNNDFSELLGWFLSEGFIYKTIPFGRRGMSKSIIICQYKTVNSENVLSIKQLFDKMKIRYRSDSKTISFSSDLWYDTLIKCGSGSRNKHIPNKWFHGLNKEILFKSLYRGDGHKNKNIYTTNSDKLKEQVLIMLTELGYKTWYNKDESGCFRIKFNKQNSRPHNKNISIVKNTNGKVYCVEVEDNHTVLAGRNNKFTWTGQSFYGYLGYEGSRLYKREVAEAITEWGINIIKWSSKVLENLGYTVVYGDTDSCVYDTKIDIKEHDTYYTTCKIGELFEESMIDGNIVKKSATNFVVIPKKEIFTPSVDIKTRKIIHNKINYIMGHKVKKKLFKIKIGDVDTIITEDHSIMVKRNGEIIEVKPTNILKTDTLLVKKRNIYKEKILGMLENEIRKRI